MVNEILKTQPHFINGKKIDCKIAIPKNKLNNTNENIINKKSKKEKEKKTKILVDDKKENEINSSNIQTQCSIKQTKNKNVNKISLIKSQSIINSDVSLYFLS